MPIGIDSSGYLWVVDGNNYRVSVARQRRCWPLLPIRRPGKMLPRIASWALLAPLQPILADSIG